jgi:hypothetical protein
LESWLRKSNPIAGQSHKAIGHFAQLVRLFRSL